MTTAQWIGLLIVVAILALVTAYVVFRQVSKLFAVREALETLGGGGKFAFWAAVMYAMFPIDLIPDPIYLDDIIVVMIATANLAKLVEQRRAALAAAPPAKKSAASQPRPGAIPASAQIAAAKAAQAAADSPVEAKGSARKRSGRSKSRRP